MNIVNNLSENISTLAFDVPKSELNVIDYSKFKDKSYWKQQKKRTFIVNAKELGLDILFSTSFLFVLYSYDIVILLLFPYEERSIYISSIWSTNEWLSWKKIS